MKKILFIILAVMGIVLTGCGKEDTKKVIYVGTNAEYKPYEYLEDGKLKGFDIDLMEAVAAGLGYEIEWKNMSFDGLLPALQTKKIDMVIAGMSPTEERKKAVDFTDIYYSSGQAIIVNKDNIEIKGLDELKGKKIGVQLGTLQEQIANSIEGTEVKAYNSFTGAVLDLNEDKLDAVIVGEAVAQPYIKNNSKLKIAGVIDDNSDGTAIALNKGQENMVAELNAQIAELKSNGEYDKLVTKYFARGK